MIHEKLLHGSFYYTRAHELSLLIGNQVGKQEEGSQPPLISVTDDFKFELFRHSNLYDSIHFSKHTAVGLHMWKDLGKKKLSTILVQLGIPLLDAHNQWNVLDSKFKRAVHESLEGVVSPYGLDQLRAPSFVRHYSQKLSISSNDMVHLLDALLEEPPVSFEETVDSRILENFWNRWDALSNDFQSLGRGIEKAILTRKLIYDNATSLHWKKQIISSGPFRYVHLPSTSEIRHFALPQNLSKLALFVRAVLRVIPYFSLFLPNFPRKLNHFKRKKKQKTNRS